MRLHVAPVSFVNKPHRPSLLDFFDDPLYHARQLHGFIEGIQSMQLERARIVNFRSVKDLTVEFGAHTALIGGNGAGKSSILKALERFFATAKTLDPDDYHGRNQSVPIEIELTFSNLTPQEAEAFESRVRNGQLVVTRIFDGTPSSGRYCGVVPQNREFSEIRSHSQATAKRAAYTKLRTENPKYVALPTASSAQAVDKALEDWEAANSSELTLERDDGQFFGFQNASRGALQRYINFVFVPAVRDAADDAADSKTSPVGRLLEILVRSAILKRPEVTAFQQEVMTRYKELVSPDKLPELDQLAENLTRDLKEIYGDASVGMTWRPAADIPIPLPAADVSLTHDGFGGPVDRQGHGLQRAFIFTLLQHLARASVPAPAGPVLVTMKANQRSRSLQISFLLSRNLNSTSTRRNNVIWPRCFVG